MSKHIAIFGRAGAGKTTIAAIISEGLSVNNTVLLIDNTQTNLNIYKAFTTCVDKVKIYLYLDNIEQSKSAIKDSAFEIKKNLYFFSGSNDILTAEEIQRIRDYDIFDYIVTDGLPELTVNADKGFIVVNPNLSERIMFEEYISENIKFVINRYDDNSEFKPDKSDFKLFFSFHINNFADGYELEISKNKEINSLIEFIVGEAKGDNKKRIFTNWKKRLKND